MGCEKQMYESEGVQNKTIQHKLASSKEQLAALGGARTHNTLLTRQSALPTELQQAGL